MPRKKATPPPTPAAQPLSAAALRAIEFARHTFRSTGWLFSPRYFDGDPEISGSFENVADELVRAGYLERHTCLKTGDPEDIEEMSLDEEEAAEALRCLREHEVFAHPRTGDEILLVPGDLYIFYYTTKKMPVAPPPPDPRATALYDRFAAELRKTTEGPDGGDCVRDVVSARVREAWQKAMSLLAEGFALPDELTKANDA